MPLTLYDKIWNDHLVDQQDDGTALLFVDRHLVHEVTSPQAFEGLRNSNRKVRQPGLTLAVADHNVPTTDRSKGIADAESKIQVDTLESNCKEFGVQYLGMNDKRQGIVHIIGPEQGFTQPGTVIVCGDSHTATHGAFGALAFGIGTSEVEHVLATQTLVQKKAKNFRINVNGKLPIGVTSKDVILQIIGNIGTAGGTGSVIEYAGSLISSLSVEQRMTICNMTIEGGARAGLIAPDEKIFEYLKGKPMSPKNENWDKAMKYWESLKTDDGAKFDKEINLVAEDILPMITWGTSPQDVITIDGKVPNPKNEQDEDKKNSLERSLNYMGLKADTLATDIKIDKVFVDEYKGAFQAVEYLIQTGCKRIAHIAGQQTLSTARHRLKAYKDALKKHKLPIIEEYIVESTGFAPEHGIDPTKKLLALPKPPDAIFTINDGVAIGAMYIIKDAGLKIPDEISVIGFDDDPHSSYFKPSLSTVWQPTYEMGMLSARILMKRINTNNDLSKIRIESLFPELIIRESSIQISE